MVWDWVIDMTKKSTEKVYKWSQENKDRRREMTREAVARYRERHKNDQEYLERERETSRRTSARYREKMKAMKAQMTPEQLEEERRKNRERQARFREKQKLNKLQEKENGPD